jgi:hypothetical protein
MSRDEGVPLDTRPSTLASLALISRKGAKDAKFRKKIGRI